MGNFRRRGANVLRLATAQALAGGNASVIFATGAIVGATIAPDPALAKLPITMFVIGMAVATLPTGAIGRRFGRRTAFLAGAGCGVAGPQQAQRPPCSRMRVTSGPDRRQFDAVIDHLRGLRRGGEGLVTVRAGVQPCLDDAIWGRGQRARRPRAAPARGLAHGYFRRRPVCLVLEGYARREWHSGGGLSYIPL